MVKIFGASGLSKDRVHLFKDDVDMSSFFGRGRLPVMEEEGNGIDRCLAPDARFQLLT